MYFSFKSSCYSVNCQNNTTRERKRKWEKGIQHQFSERHRVTEKEVQEVYKWEKNTLPCEDAYNTADVYRSYAPVHLSDTVSKQRAWEVHWCLQTSAWVPNTRQNMTGTPTPPPSTTSPFTSAEHWSLTAFHSPIRKQRSNMLKEIEEFTKNENSFIVYSPSCHYNSIFIFFF